MIELRTFPTYIHALSAFRQFDEPGFIKKELSTRAFNPETGKTILFFGITEDPDRLRGYEIAEIIGPETPFLRSLVRNQCPIPPHLPTLEI